LGCHSGVISTRFRGEIAWLYYCPTDETLHQNAKKLLPISPENFLTALSYQAYLFFCSSLGCHILLKPDTLAASRFKQKGLLFSQKKRKPLKMMDPHDLVIAHDQLPDVEEYKASSHFKGSQSFHKRPDPDGFDSLPASNQSFHSSRHSVEDEEDHLDLPDDLIYDSEEDRLHRASGEIKTEHAGWFWKLCFSSSVLLIILVIAGVAVGITKKDEGDGSSGPSWVRNSKRYSDIRDYLTQTGISKTNDLFDETSPQHLAAQWLAHQDSAKLAIPYDRDTREHLGFVERYALAVFYYATGGPDWTRQLNFLGKEHVCTWYQAFDVISDDYDLFEGDFVIMGIHGCKRVNDDELAPFSLYLRE
jgi:hypothetical protein